MPISLAYDKNEWRQQYSFLRSEHESVTVQLTKRIPDSRKLKIDMMTVTNSFSKTSLLPVAYFQTKAFFTDKLHSQMKAQHCEILN